MRSDRKDFGLKYWGKGANVYFKHLIFWICFFVVGYLTDLVLYPNAFLAKELVLFFTHNLFLFYSIGFCLKHWSAKSTVEIIRSLGRCLVVIVVFCGMRLYLNYKVYPVMDDMANVPRETIVIEELMMNAFFWILEYFFFASAYFYFQSSIQKQKDLTQVIEEKLTKEKEAIQLEKEKIELEKENIQLENTALKAQINPHFLYNTLNFLYAKSLPVSAELADGVMKLSDIMRYSLKPQDTEGLVFLADEAEHIQNIVEMNKLRFNNKLNVLFETDDITHNIKIIPLVLITLVENVFKHGTTNSAEHPAIIRLAVNENHQLCFSTHNKKRTGPKELSTGIGLNNALKRLKNTYQHRCTTTVNQEGDYFSVILQIQLFKNEKNYFA